MKRCDLHTHSYCSDGSFAPSEIVKLAEKAGVSAVALTDHNTAKGLAEFTEAGARSGVITVAGCEFSTDYNGTELHIVGLFFPRESWKEIEDFVELTNIAKKNSNLRLIEALQNEGFDIRYEEVAAITDADEFNRAHVARVMTEKGYVNSVDEAFNTYLKESNGLYVPPKRISAFATVEFIKNYGGVAVIAHPFLNLSYDGLLEFLPEAKKRGLDATETRYSTFTEAETKQAEELAERFGLLQSGGSDFHGIAKPDIELGTGRGELFVPFEFYEKLKERA
ncbi:MAG: PHP domain-containing protein [Eubacterium sp.]|nr:PHP domain-containing protein [Eubacterium sp.]